MQIFPVWHQVDASFIASVSPLLADRYSVSSSQGVDSVAELIASQFPPVARYTGRELAITLEHLRSATLFSCEAIGAGCRYRFLQMNDFKAEYCEIVDAAFSKLLDEGAENVPTEFDQQFKDEHERLRIKHKIPEDVYLTSDESIREEHLGGFIENIEGWASGTLSRSECQRLIHDLDLQELDEYFILLGLPNFSISAIQRDLLELALIEIGCGFEDSYIEVEKLCEKLAINDSYE